MAEQRPGGFNQKGVCIQKTPVNMKEDAFLCSKREVYRNAMRNLKGNTFKLWLILEDNKPDYHLYLSTKHIADECGFSQRTAQNSVDELVEKGYLVLLDPEYNEYIFYDTGKDNFIG